MWHIAYSPFRAFLTFAGMVLVLSSANSRAADSPTSTPKEMDRYARGLWSEGKYEESLRTCQLMQRQHPNDLWASWMGSRGAVLCLQRLGRYDEATSAAKKAIERFGESREVVDPEDPRLPLGIEARYVMTTWIGDNLTRQRSYERAVAEYQRAMRFLDDFRRTECTSPSQAAAALLFRNGTYGKLAACYAEAGQYEKAAQMCDAGSAALADALTSDCVNFLFFKKTVPLWRYDQEISLPKQAADYYEKAGLHERAKTIRARLLSVSRQAAADGRYKAVQLDTSVELVLNGLERDAATTTSGVGQRPAP